MPRRIAMPESVKIGPHSYSIVRSTAKVNAKEAAIRGSLFAYIDNGLLQIVLDEEPVLTGTALRESLVHECLHGIMETQGLSYGLGEKAAYTEEGLLQALDTPILALLRDNPDLLAWLTAED